MPERNSHSELATELHSTAIHLLRRARRDDRSFGVSAARLSALSVLVFGGPQRLGALAELEQVKAPTMTRMVQAMDRDGLVRVKAAKEDGRVRLVHATAAGRRILEAARLARIENLSSVIEALTEKEQARMASALAALRRTLAETG